MRLIYVEWVDSCSVMGGVWKRGDDVRGSVPSLCKSVGFLIAQDKKRVIIAAHRSEDGCDQFGGDMCIPRCSITKVRRLKL